MSENMALWEISAAMETAIEGGYTVNPETGAVMFDPGDLERLAEMREDKLEACGLYIKSLDAAAKAIREEEKALAARRQSMERKAERMREYVLRDMLADGTVIDTPRLHMKPAKKPASVEVIDADLLPDEFRRTKVEPMKAEIAKALKAGRSVPGAALYEGGHRLAIK